jgi:cobalamin biosynthesis protein CobD/CbiB
MARPITWLPRLHEIRRSVADSVRSHYTRRELEVLFQIQQGAASRLLEIVPTLTVNGSYLAEREGLLAFLDRVSETEDVTTLMRRLRAEKQAPTRRSVRTMVRRDTSPVSLAGSTRHAAPGTRPSGDQLRNDGGAGGDALHAGANPR